MKSLVSAQKSRPAWFGAEAKIVDLSRDSVHASWPPPLPSCCGGEHRHSRKVGQKNIFPPKRNPNEDAFQSSFRPPVPVVWPSFRL